MNTPTLPTDVAKESRENGEILPATKRAQRKCTALALTICFATGLLLCWRTNFSHTALDVASMFDSGKYISSTELVMNATTFLHHFNQQEWKTICSALKEPNDGRSNSSVAGSGMVHAHT